SYNVTITKIDLEGPDTPDKAFEGTATIKATVQAWNDGNGSVTAGNNHLKVSTNVLSFPSSVGNDIIDVFTDHPDGWVIDKIEGPSREAIDWLTATPNNGAFNVTQPLTIDVLEAGPVNRSALIYIQAGNVTLVITVSQKRKVMLTFTKNIDAAGSFIDLSGLYDANTMLLFPNPTDNSGYDWDGWYDLSTGLKVVGHYRRPLIIIPEDEIQNYEARWVLIP
ncbi:BACON domain-containing protein, partial [Dysgonomonas termitidis]